METDEFLSYVISDLNYFVYLSVFEDSKTRIENVNFLIQKAKSFEKDNFKGIFSFIRYVENIKDSNSDDCAKTIGENDNVVRLMSIHKSKGLEFPVVILAGMGNGFNNQDIKRLAVFHKDFGIGADSIYADKGYKLQSLNKISIKHKIKYETVSEELRVLYVALTRPIDKLIITGIVKNGPKFLRNVEAKISVQDYSISPYTVLKSSSFLEMILLASSRSALCELGEVKDSLIFDDGIKYNVSIKNMNTLRLPESTKKPSDWQKEFTGTTEEYENISSFLNFEYPYKTSSLVSGNISVTEIKKMNMNQNGEDMFYDDIVLKKPINFANSGKIYGSALGTLVHLCMEKLDFSRMSAQSDIAEQINSFVSAGIISEEEFKTLDISKFIKFSESSLGRRMIENLSTLKKEVSFKILTDISKLYGISSNDSVVVQGTIDAYFEDTDGELVLIDYKTDKVNKDGTQQVASRYRIQLETYANALEKILGKKVKEKYIYLFDIDEIIPL
ncbi:MAG: PD-(D/E)XK nuclease family protein [Clostridia bacterium]|nr:PD-(D/E)XK nuclease family protein [Clostridia bacterium]